jgi:hypothetical protein
VDVGAGATRLPKAFLERRQRAFTAPVRAVDRVADEAIGDLTREAGEARLARADPDRDLGPKGGTERSLELAEVVPVVFPVEPIELTRDCGRSGRPGDPPVAGR